MAVNFPNSPILYQIFSTSDNSFIWNGSQWVGYSTSLVVNYNASSVVIQDDNSIVGATTSINFGSNLDVSFAAGVVTVTATGGGGGGESYWVSTSAGIHTLSKVGIGTTNPNGNEENRLYVNGPTILNGDVDISGITTSTNGFTSSIGVTNPVKITVSGNQLTFTVPGVGSTTLTLF
jgi:hypothetical protein